MRMSFVDCLKCSWFEIALGLGIVVWGGLTWFLVYFFVVYLIRSQRQNDYVRKLTRTSRFFSDIKLQIIMEKLNIEEAEIQALFEKEKSKFNEKEMEKFNQDFDLSSSFFL